MSYSSSSPTCSSPSSSGCKYKRALLRGFRPSAQNQKLQCGVCPNRCIYCDIWKLATLIYSHVPAGLKSQSRPSSPSSSSASSSPHLSRSSSSASNNSDSNDDGSLSSKSIQAAFQTQRARLASILSICTVDGADECEGLRLAHDRCLISVTDLMNKERMLQERAAAVRHEYAAAQLELEQQQRQSSVRRISRECASGSLRERYMDESRRASVIGMAR